MPDIIQPGQPRRDKRSEVYRFIIRKGLNLDPPISRDLLGEPNTVVLEQPGNQPPKKVTSRKCLCCECGTVFWHHEPSVLCPDCEADLQVAMSLIEHVPNGNLPPRVSRTVGETKRVTGKGVRPRVMGDDPE